MKLETSAMPTLPASEEQSLTEKITSETPAVKYVAVAGANSAF